jgi:hypothetical protein
LFLSTETSGGSAVIDDDLTTTDITVAADGSGVGPTTVTTYSVLELVDLDEVSNEISVPSKISRAEIDELAAALNAGNHSQVMLSLATNTYVVRELLAHVIEAAYSNRSGNIHNVLSLMDHVASEDYKILILESVWDQISANNDTHQFHAIMVGCHVKLLMTETPALDAVALTRLELLRDDLPDVVRFMFWGHVCLRNVRYCEYLYADGQLFNTDRRHIFTWRPKGKNQRDQDQYHWTFEGIDRCKSFALKNQRKEYLFAAKNYVHAKNRRRVFSWVPGGMLEQGEWKLEQELVGESIFRLRNLHHNEYLFAGRNDDAFDEQRRAVFSGLARPTNPCSKWEMKICP